MAAERSCIFIRADFFLGQHPQPVHLLFGPWPRHGLRQPHRGQLGPVVGVADHRRRIVRKDARHRRQVADVTVDNAKQRDDCGLVGGDAVEIADVGLLRMSICVVGEIGRHASGTDADPVQPRPDPSICRSTPLRLGAAPVSTVDS
jgi:hypothetical protein